MADRRWTAIVAAFVLLSGCLGAVGADRAEPTTNAANGTLAPTTTTAVSTTPVPATTETTATAASTPRSTGDREYEFGDQLLSVDRITPAEATNFDGDRRANVTDLDDAERDAFLRALDCDCNVEGTPFGFHDEERVRVVRYEGRWYYLRVAIV